MRIMLIFAALSGCAGVGASTVSDEDALARELAGRVAWKAETCLDPLHSRSLTPIDSQTLIYRAGDTVWVNRLAAPCPGIEPLTTLIVEAHGGRYCRGDLVRGLEAGASIPGPSCPLGEWVPYRRAE